MPSSSGEIFFTLIDFFVLCRIHCEYVHCTVQDRNEIFLNIYHQSDWLESVSSLLQPGLVRL